MEIANLLTKVSETMHVSRSFGPASEHDGVTIVPVAIVVGGGGGGTQPIEGSSDAARTDADAGVATGSGGGFGTVSWPIGVYAVKDGHVRWVPVLDVTRLAIAAISAAKLIAKLRAARALRKG
jgi:uncharacterized spore protein YtfJ